MIAMNSYNLQRQFGVKIEKRKIIHSTMAGDLKYIRPQCKKLPRLGSVWASFLERFLRSGNGSETAEVEESTVL